MARTAPTEKAKQELPQNSRDLSDDELAGDEPTWEWIYNSTPTTERSDDPQSDRKRRKVVGDRIVGARIGQFECRIGDTVMLKADGFNEVWVALICEFVEDDGEGEKAANFMWFSSEREIRNKDKKRTDFFPVRYKLCETAELNLTSLFRTNSTYPHHGTSTPWRPSMERPRLCPMTPSYLIIPKAEFLEIMQTLVRSLSAGEAATLVLQLIQTSLYGKRYTMARMISLL